MPGEHRHLFGRYSNGRCPPEGTTFHCNTKYDENCPWKPWHEKCPSSSSSDGGSSPAHSTNSGVPTHSSNKNTPAASGPSKVEFDFAERINTKKAWEEFLHD